MERFFNKGKLNFQSPKMGEEEKMEKYFFVDIPVVQGVYCTRLSVEVFTTLLRESAKWLQIFCNAQELPLAVFRSSSGGGDLSPAEIRRRLSVLRHIPVHH